MKYAKAYVALAVASVMAGLVALQPYVNGTAAMVVAVALAALAPVAVAFTPNKDDADPDDVL